MSIIGREVLLIKPTLENPRNTEGAFALLNDGTIMFAYTRFIGGHLDHSEAEIYAVFSHDDGETWGEGRTVLQKQTDDVNIMSISFLRMLDGSLGMFYLRKTGEGRNMDCLLNLVCSYDEGITWSEPYSCIDGRGYYVVNNDRVVRLESGRVVFPAAFHPDGGLTGTVCFFISDDDCKTFHEAKVRLKLPFERTNSGMQEPGVVELDDGRLWAWARTSHGYQFEAFSDDEGETWSRVNPNEYFTSPCSPMNVKRLQNGCLLAVFNPVPVYNGRFLKEDVLPDSGSKIFDMYHTYTTYANEGRTPIVCAISDGGTMDFKPGPKSLEDNPELGFAYPSILPRKDYVLVAYYITRDNFGYDDANTNLFGIRIKKIALEELR